MPKPRQILPLPDRFSGADDAGSFLIKVNAHETVQCKVVFTAFDICLVGVPVGGKSQCHGVFGNCFRRITGNTCHLDPAFCCSFQINIIVSGTAHQDQFYTLAVKFFNDRCAEICIYKCTDGIVAVGKSCGFFMDICFNEFNFNTWIRWKQLLKNSLS